MTTAPLRSGRLAAALSLCLAAWLVPAAAQQDDGTEPVGPIEDLEGQYHFTPELLVDILSSNSLMLTRDQIASIESAKRLSREQTEVHEEFAGLTQDATATTTIDRNSFQLDAIMYLSRQRWTFWLNGEAVTPEAIPQGIAVLEVAPNRVEMTWTPDASRPDSSRRFVLEPGQVYVVAQGAVMEADEAAASVQDQTDAGGAAQDAAAGDDADDSGDGSGSGNGATDNAAPGDLALAPQQVEQLAELQQALAIVSGNAAALGMTEEELQQLQQSLAASGDTSTLSPEQQEQLQRIQQATGIE